MKAAEEERVQAAMLEEQNQIAQELLKREMETEENNTSMYRSMCFMINWSWSRQYRWCVIFL